MSETEIHKIAIEISTSEHYIRECKREWMTEKITEKAQLALININVVRD